MLKQIPSLPRGLLARLAVSLLISVATVSAGSESRAMASSAQIAEVDKIFAAWNRSDSPGCLAFAFHNGNILFSKGYGMADLEWSQPIDADTVFYIASTSKQFTAASIALLILDGKLSLDADVRKFIPEVPAFGTPIKVRDLVFHTSGLRDYFGLRALIGERSALISNQDVLNLVSRQQDLNFKPGSSWAYSNTNYVLLSVLVERVSGMTLAEFAQQRLFAPLGMNHTHFDDHHQRIVPRRASGYTPGAEGEWLTEPKLIDATGDGNLLTTVADLQRWDENFYHPIVGGQPFLDLIQKAGAQVPGANFGYAFGLFVGASYRGVPVVHHAGSFGGFAIHFARLPGQHFSVGALCNAANAPAVALASQMTDVFLKDQLNPVESPATNAAPPGPAPVAKDLPTYTLTANAARAYVGNYRNPEVGAEAVVTLKEGTLHFAGANNLAGDLVPVAADRFTLMYFLAPGQGVPQPFRAERDKQGNVRRLIVDFVGINNFRFEKVD